MSPEMASLPRLEPLRPIANWEPIGGGGIDPGGGFPRVPNITNIQLQGPGFGGSGGGVGGGATSAGFGPGSLLSSVLGLPAINWGRIAAFLLGLLLIGGGLFLIKGVRQQIRITTGHVRRAAELLAEE